VAGSEFQARTAGNPYVGPRPFETGEHLPGREREITELYYLLSAERIVLLHSPSGAGKSSLIQAGLIPRLRERFDVWHPTRVNTPLPSGLKDGVNRYALSAALGFEQSIPESLRRSPEQIAGLSLSEYATKRLRRPSAPESVLLIFDQFEEILTADPLAVKAKQEFFDQLGELLRNPLIWALFAIREDYLAQLDPYAEQVPTHFKNRSRIDLLGLDQAREAIAGPSRDAGREFTDGAADKLVRDLAAMKVQQADGTFVVRTGLHVEPLQLQVVCRGLWDRMPPDSVSAAIEDVEQFGNVTEALSAYYSAEIEKIAGREAGVERAIREWVGEKLITLEGIRGQVLRGAGRSDGLANDLIAKLVNTHLVRAEQRAGAVWYELAHDRLIEPVRESNSKWFLANLSALQRESDAWVSKGRPGGLLMRGEALAEAERWAAAHEQELKPSEVDFLAAGREARRVVERELAQARRVRRWVWVAMVVFLVAAVAVVVAVNQTSKALKATGKAEIADQNAQAATARSAQEAQRAAAATAEAAKKTLEAEQASAAAKEEATVADQQSRQARIARANLLAAQAQENADSFPQRSLLLAVEALNVTRGAGDPPTASANQALRTALANSGGRVLGGHEASVTDVAVSPDGRWLISVSGEETSPQVHTTVRLWDMSGKDQPTKPVVLPGARAPAVMSADGRWVVTGSMDSAARLWRLDPGKSAGAPILLERGEHSVTAPVISPDGRWLITGSDSHFARLRDLTAASPGTTFKDLGGGSGAFVVSHSSQWLVTGLTSNCPTYASGSGDSPMLWDLTSTDLRAAPRPLSGHTMPVTSAAFSPDGHWLVTASACYVTHTGRMDSTARLWNLKDTGRFPTPNELLGHKGPIGRLAISPDNHWVASAGGGDRFGLASIDRTVYLWPLTEAGPGANPVVLTSFEGHIRSMAFGNGSGWLVTLNDEEGVAQTGYEGRVRVRQVARLWDLKAKEPASAFRVLTDGGVPVSVSAIAISRDGHWLLTGNGTKGRLWDLTSRSPADRARMLRGHEGSIGAAAFGADGTTVITGSEDKAVRVWHTAMAEHSASPITLESDGDSFLSPDGSRLVTRIGKTAQVWDLTTPDPTTKPLVLSTAEQIYSVAISPDNHWLAMGDYAKTASLFDLTSTDPRRNVRVLAQHSGAIPTVAISSDNHWLFTGSFDGTTRAWDLTSRNPEAASILFGEVDKSSSKAVFRVDVSPSGRWLVATGQAPARLWDLKSKERATVLLAGNGAALFSASSRWLVNRSGVNQPRAYRWDLTASAPATTFRTLEGGARAIVFSPDSRWLVTAGDADGSVRLWDLMAAPATHPRILPGHHSLVWSAAISPDSRWLVTGDDDGIARLWELGARDPASTAIVLRGHRKAITSAAITMHWIATGSFYDNTVRLWDRTARDVAASGAVLPHDGSVTQTAFTPDEHWLITGVYTSGGPKPALVWNLRQDELTRLACRTSGRNLTATEWEQYFFGQPYHATCTELPPGEGATTLPAIAR
jgi:WD40 repeat protein